MATHTREQYVFLAKLAEQAERYDGTKRSNNENESFINFFFL